MSINLSSILSQSAKKKERDDLVKKAKSIEKTEGKRKFRTNILNTFKNLLLDKAKVGKIPIIGSGIKSITDQWITDMGKTMSGGVQLGRSKYGFDEEERGKLQEQFDKGYESPGLNPMDLLEDIGLGMVEDWGGDKAGEFMGGISDEIARSTGLGGDKFASKVTEQGLKDNPDLEEVDFWNYKEGGKVPGYYGGGSVSSSPTIFEYFAGQGKTPSGSNVKSLLEMMGKK